MNKNKWLVPVLCIGIVLCMGVTMWALFFRDGGKPIAPDYPPQGTEANQKPLEGDESEKMESPQGGGSINVTYNVNATVDLSEGTVSLLYANPQASNQDVAILIMIDDLDTLTLDEYAAGKLSVGGYDAELVIRAYDPESGEKAMVDTKGQLSLTVVE